MENLNSNDQTLSQLSNQNINYNINNNLINNSSNKINGINKQDTNIIDINQSFARKASLNEPESTYQEYIEDLSNVLDMRIAEITDQLQESKKELLEQFKNDLSQQTLLQVNLKDLHYNFFSEEENFGIKSVSKLKKFKECLDSYLKNIDSYLDLKEKFSKGKINDVIKMNTVKNKFEFAKFKIGKGSKGPSLENLWDGVQHKNNFTLMEDSKAINIKYNNCYELYVSKTVYKNGINIIRMEVDCISTTIYHSIGLINESYTFGSSCVCLKSLNSFMFDRSGNVFCNSNTVSSGIVFSDGQKHVFEIELNLENENEKFMIVKFNDSEYGPYKITGTKFKVAVGMCNGGNVIYRFLD